MEDVPLIGEFIVNNAERDVNDFNGYSSMFTIDYFEAVRSKIEVCKELVKLAGVPKELKSVTFQLYDRVKAFRMKLNALEGYLKTGADNLDVAVKDTGFKNVRMYLTKGNIEGLLSNLKTMLIVVKRNLSVLEEQGLTQTHIDEVEAQLQEINLLHEKQNELRRKRNRLTDENINRFNDLWNNMRLIMNVAKAIYQEVDEVKLKDYTVAHLKKKINAQR
jgi:hypothetical protein